MFSLVPALNGDGCAIAVTSSAGRDLPQHPARELEPTQAAFPFSGAAYALAVWGDTISGGALDSEARDLLGVERRVVGEMQGAGARAGFAAEHPQGAHLRFEPHQLDQVLCRTRQRAKAIFDLDGELR